MPSWPTATSWPVGGSFPRGTPLDFISTVAVIDFWFAGQNVASTGGLVDTWTGAKGNVATGTLTARPALTASDAGFGGLPCITGDGVNDELTTALAIPAPGTSPRYYWAMLRQTSGTIGVLFGGAGPCEILFQNGGSPNVRGFNGVSGATNANLPFGAVKRVELSFTNSASDFLSVGSVINTGVNTGNTSAATWNMFSLGGANWCNCSISALLITIGAPSASERSAMDAWALNLGYPVSSLA